MKIVQNLLKKHATNDPRKICTQENIKIIYEDLGKTVWGYYSKLTRIPQIHINNRLSEDETTFAICHELGHHAMHSHLNTPFLRKSTFFSLDKIEREAYKFAVHLIVGHGKPQSDETLKSFLSRCGVPIDFHEFY